MDPARQSDSNFWNPNLLHLLTRATVTVSFFTHGFWGAFFGFILGRFLKSSALPNDILPRIYESTAVMRIITARR